MTDLKKYFTPLGWEMFCELDLPPGVVEELAGRIAHAAGCGPLHYTYDMEMDFHGATHDIMEALATALERNGEDFNFPFIGGYAIGSAGNGYISIGIGNEGASAICGYWISQEPEL